jgi:hypothetical protein
MGSNLAVFNKKNLFHQNLSLKFLFLMIFMVVFLHSKSQVTTSGIKGVVTNGTIALQNVSISAILNSNGEIYNTQSQKKGNYNINNLKSGGPYTIITISVGYYSDTIKNIYLDLGNYFIVDIQLTNKTNNEKDVTVIGNLKNKISFGNSIGSIQLSQTPTISRGLQDFTRLTAQANGNSFSGANYRYNNLSIDGASLNDAFGFTEPSSGAGGSLATGNPGGLAKTQPISLEAIKEVQVELSPFNVVLGNFTGGSVNAVTKSGTNTNIGSVFFSGRNQSITGKSADNFRTKIDKFYDFQTGFRIGGPIIKNKLFYFVAAEIANKNEPVGFAPGSTGAAIPVNIAKAIADTLKKRYDFESGSYDKIQLQNNSTKIFAKIDWNINTVHKLSIRNNYVKAFADYGERSANVLNYQSQGFTHHSTTNSAVLELRSNFAKNISNNLILGYTQTNDYRETNGSFFPHIEITYNTANTIFAGTYREAAVYGLNLKTLEWSDNVTYTKSKHTFTAGIHNEIYNVNYKFLTAFNGRWAYRNIDDFYANKPSRIRGVYNLQNNDYLYNRATPSAEFRVFLLSQYIQDEIAVNKKLQLTIGLRSDITTYPDRPEVNPLVTATKEFASFQNKNYAKPQLAPRFGFTYNVLDNKKLVLRGGTGIFNGRMPFAWLAYPYYNSGTTYGNVDIRPTSVVSLNNNIANVAATLQPGIREINLLDNNFKLPKVLRNSLGVDIKIKNNWTFSVEATYTKTLQDVLYKTINLKDSTSTLKGLGDNRTVYLGSGNQQKYNASFTNVFLLTNTKDGYRYGITTSIGKKYKTIRFNTAYTYGVSKDKANGVRVSPQANWEFNQTIKPNDPELSFSNFDLRHRSISTFQYTKNWKKSFTNVTLVYVSQSGAPYTYTYIGDINRDGSPNNDLIYIPKNQSESNLTDIKDINGNVINSANNQWNQLNEFINEDKYLNKKRGQYAERNGARTPWNNQLDFKINHTIALGKIASNKSIMISLDVINLSNLISKNWGRQYYVPNVLNSNYQLLTVARANTTTPPELNFNTVSATPWQYDPILSRAQGQLSVRYNF